MAKKTEEVKVVETKVAKVDRKALAESIEKAFAGSKVTDVIADTNLDTPTGMSYEEYRFIHFYKPGTRKDLFQLYINGKTGMFYVRNAVAECLAEDVEKTPALKKQKNGEMKINLYIVKTPIETVPEVANKILDACAKSDAALEQKKAEKEAAKKAAKEQKAKEKEAKAQAKKDAEQKVEPKKATPKKATQATNKTEKKAANK